MCSKGPHGPIGTWDVSRVTDMNRIFAGAESFDGDLSKWDVSGVKNMQAMFLRAKSFNGDLSNWDVSNVNDMHGMFMGATNFNRKLCGSAWVHSRAKKTVMFDGSSGSISTKTCTGAVPFSAFSPRTASELKNAVGTYLKFSRNRYLRTGYCGNYATRLFSARQFSGQARTEVDKDQTITIYPSDPKVTLASLSRVAIVLLVNVPCPSFV